MSASTWPWPGDSALDRARRVARSYRETLLAEFPDACAALDRRLVDQLGQAWLVPTLATVDLDEWVTIGVAAEHVGLSEQGVYAWVYAGKIEARKGRDGRVRVQLGKALEVKALQRQRRARRAAS